LRPAEASACRTSRAGESALTRTSEAQLLLSPSGPEHFGSRGTDLSLRSVKGDPLFSRGSSHRHDPYHALLPASGGNRRQRFWLVSEVFAPIRFATDCHRLPPRGLHKGSILRSSVLATAPKHAEEHCRRLARFRSRAARPRSVTRGRRATSFRASRIFVGCRRLRPLGSIGAPSRAALRARQTRGRALGRVWRLEARIDDDPSQMRSKVESRTTRTTARLVA
jgi:hypothetical protein